MTQKLQATIETITPEQARLWLASNTHNRNLKDSYIVRLAEAIARGEWELNGESIKFNSDVLVDGQHRLAAIVRANIPVLSVVVRGIPLSAQETVDTGSRRTLSDILKLRGETNYSLLASAIVFQHRFAANALERSATRTYPTAQQALKTLSEHPGLRDSLPVGDRVRKHFRISGSIVAFLHYTFATIDSDDADDFFDKLLRGSDLPAGHPILALRSSLERDAINRSSRRTAAMNAAYFIKAWNAYREGRSLTLLKWNPGGAHAEAFPVPA